MGENAQIRLERPHAKWSECRTSLKVGGAICRQAWDELKVSLENTCVERLLTLPNMNDLIRTMARDVGELDDLTVFAKRRRALHRTAVTKRAAFESSVLYRATSTMSG